MPERRRGTRTGEGPFRRDKRLTRYRPRDRIRRTTAGTHVRVAMAERRLARTHCASERRLWSRACRSWCGGLRRGGEASRVPGLPRLSADEAHTRQLLLDARLVCRHLLLVLCTSHQPAERGKIAAVRRGSAARGGISARLCGGAAWRCLIDAPASSRAAWAPSPGTLCGAAGTSCTNRLRVLRRISSSARRRSGERGEKVSVRRRRDGLRDDAHLSPYAARPAVVWGDTRVC